MKTKLLTLLALAFIGLSTANAQVGIGTTNPDPSAILEVDVTSLTEKKGFLPPRMDTDARNDINSPTEGLTIYNIENNCLEFWNDNYWVSACDGSAQPGALSDCPTIPPYLPADDTEIVDVTNPDTGRTWMDRNLGAYTPDRTTPSAAGGTDCWAYGNVYQWGRNSDGHESRLLDCANGDCFDANGNNTTLPATAADVTDPTWAGKFIYNVDVATADWHQDTPDNTLWTSTGGTNNPCPAGYHVPTETEWQNEFNSWGTIDAEGAINSLLKLPLASGRTNAGDMPNVGIVGRYYSSTADASNIKTLSFVEGNYVFNSLGRVNGLSVRCIKD